MNLFITPFSDPCLNLATEEFLLKNSTGDYILLYTNQPSVVVGKHQITPKEINSEFVKANNIRIARRLSGGGAVYHDQGNLNFSFIRTIPINETASYRQLTSSLVSFLRSVGIHISLSARNDLMLEEYKISGSAMHVFKNRVLAHGTLLIESDLNKLSGALKGHPERYTDKSIQSVRSGVLNLSSRYNKINIIQLITQFTDFLIKEYSIRKLDTLPEDQIASIHEIAKTKYSSEDWIYGYSPKYIYKGELEFMENPINYELTVEKGIIEKINIKSEVELDPTIKLVFNSLKGLRHNIESLQTAQFSVGPKTLIELIRSSLF